MTKRIALVVDDNSHMRAHLVQRLREVGLDTVEAQNGVEALQVLGDGGHDLIVTDIVMPEMDGMELCEEVRRRADLRSLPIIVSSTPRDSSYVIQALRRGADDYLSKPASSAAMRTVIDRVMSRV